MRENLKHERKVVLLIESGRLFHNTGAEKEKVRSPYVTKFTVKSSLEDEHRLSCGCYCGRKNDKKARQSLWIILKVMSRTWNIIRDSTSSQCRLSKGRFDVLVSFSSSDEACGSVLNCLKFIHALFWETVKDTITVVQTCYY